MVTVMTKRKNRVVFILWRITVEGNLDQLKVRAL